MLLRKFLLLVVLLFAAHANAADKVYRWKDEQGVWHLSDTPKGAAPPPAPYESRDARGRKVYSDRSPEEIRQQQKSLVQQMNCYRDYAEVVSPVTPRQDELILLGASWCPVTEEVRGWLLQNHIRFREYDIERTARGSALYARLQDKGLPIILVGRYRMHGFYADALGRILGESGY